MPPAYLQEQTEANIDRFTGFLSHDLERLELYVELREPLDRVEPVVLDRTEQVITELEVREPPPAAVECTPDSLERLAGDLADEFAGLSDGRLPESVPSLETLDEDCRRREFDRWIDEVAGSPRLDPETARIIEDERDDLRASFVEGDTRAFLEEAAPPLVSPVIDDSLEEIRRELQTDDRLDLLDKLADSSHGLTREDIDVEADLLRDAVSEVSGRGTVALLMVIVGSLLLAAVHIPHPKGMLRWPGLSLLLGGGLGLLVGLVLSSAVPGWIGDAVRASSSDTPTALVSLVGDLVESFVRQLTGGVIPGTVTVLLVGAALFVTSFFADRLWSAVRAALSGPPPDLRPPRSERQQLLYGPGYAFQLAAIILSRPACSERRTSRVFGCPMSPGRALPEQWRRLSGRLDRRATPPEGRPERRCGHPPVSPRDRLGPARRARYPRACQGAACLSGPACPSPRTIWRKPRRYPLAMPFPPHGGFAAPVSCPRFVAR